MQRILVITDSPKTLSAWQQQLVKSGYPVSVVSGERKAVSESVSPRPPDIFLLDGTSVRMTPRDLRSLLEGFCPDAEPFILWLITEEMPQRLDPTLGFDEFIVMPATTAELLARIKLHLWRTHRVDSADLVVAGGLIIDQANYSVTLNGARVELTYKEYELLRFLATHRGRVFTREALLNQVWGYDYYGGTRTVDVHIRRIRAKLGPEHEHIVDTVRNVGYRFEL